MRNNDNFLQFGCRISISPQLLQNNIPLERKCMETLPQGAMRLAYYLLNHLIHLSIAIFFERTTKSVNLKINNIF